jgi:hypothetical protein
LLSLRVLSSSHPPRIKSAGKERLKIQITRDDIKAFMQEAKQIMEHPAEILLNQKDLRVQRDLFGQVFEKTPTYVEILMEHRNCRLLSSFLRTLHLIKTNW